MSGKKCKHCGSSDIEVDPARGDAVCTNCGTVLEDNIIVAEVEFVEDSHGGASAIGQFVSSDSKGGATGFGGAFNAGIGQESREITLKRARNGITSLCQQLRLNQQCIDIACNFFKMALSRHLTKGRPSAQIQAACVYITCRTEGTAHLLIDISDALQICCYQLGRTYFRLSRALCINIPSIDPCIYILRFASQLQFGDKKHEVSMTALRLVQRMKRDSIHSGRRPSGLCGAALLIAGRLHNFSRTPADLVRIVKVHESTLRKRLMEFGETPSSALTLDEFMTVDLEEEQDPPAFRAARKRDKERLQKLLDEEDGEKELTQLQREIDLQIERDILKRKKIPQVKDVPEKSEHDYAEATKFVTEETLHLVGEIVKEVEPNDSVKKDNIQKGLGVDMAMMGLSDDKDTFLKPEPKNPFTKDITKSEDLFLNQKDEEYINSLIMSESESSHKTMLWNKVNAGYLKDQKIKEELRAKERDENKDKKKKLRGSYKKKPPISASTAGEAINKMLLEKKISSKINYDILKSLDQTPATPVATVAATSEDAGNAEISETTKPVLMYESEPVVLTSPVPAKRKKKNTKVAESPKPSTPAPPTPVQETADDYDDYIVPETMEPNGEMSLAAMLQNGQEEDYDDYEEY